MSDGEKEETSKREKEEALTFELKFFIIKLCKKITMGGYL